MNAVVAWSMKFRRLVVAGAAVAIAAGIATMPSAPIDALPEISPPYVEIQTEALGLSAEEVEQLITVPLEADLLNGVAWLDTIESESVPGLSSIVLTFEPGTDPIRARQMVAERLTQAHALPNVSKPPVMLQPLSSSNRLMMIGLSSDRLSLIDMSVLARWTVKPRLLGVPGVANVSIWGQRERQLQVLVDPRRLQKTGVTLGEVVETTGNALWVSPLTFLEASTPGTGGFIDTPNQRLGIQHVLPITSAEELGKVRVANEDSRYRLSDVATVVEDHQPLIGDGIVDGETGLLLVVEKFPGANTFEVTRSVEEAMAALRPAIEGIRVDTAVFRPATYLQRALDNLTLAILAGLVLAVAAIAALLYEWRAGLISLVTIPLALVISGLVLVALGGTLNVMVAAGFLVALGILVDDAVVTTSSVRAELRAGDGDEGSRAARVLLGVLWVRGTILYSLVVMGLALLPLLIIGGASGALLPPMVVALVVAMLSSLLVSVTVAPALTLMLLGDRPLARREPRLLHRLRAAYGEVLDRIVIRTRPVIVVAGAAALGAVALFAISMAPQLGRAAAPMFQDRDVLIHWDGPPSSSHTAMQRIVARATAELRTIPGVRNVGAHVGRAIFSDRVVGINAGEIWLSIAADAPYESTMRAVQDVVDGYPGLRRELVTYGAERVDQIIGGTRDDIVVRVYGDDPDAILAKASELREVFREINGITAARVDAPVVEPTVEIEVDLAAAERYGLTPGEIRRASTTLISGLEVGNLFEGQKIFEVVVWGVPELRRNLSDIRDLPIATASGELIRLADVADVRIAPAPVSVQREAVQRMVDIGLTVENRDVSRVLEDVALALAIVDFPLETHAEILGHAAAHEAARGTLLGVGAAVAIGIFLVLQAAVLSWRLAALFFLALPAALSGGVVVAWLLGPSATFGALLGLLAVLGLATRGGLALISRVRELERQGHRAERWRAVHGARLQLGPTLATTLATAGLLVPFAILGARPGIEIIHPMALVILAGLLSLLAINLFVLPSFCVRVGSTPERTTVALPIEQPERQTGRQVKRQAIGAS